MSMSLQHDVIAEFPGYLNGMRDEFERKSAICAKRTAALGTTAQDRLDLHKERSRTRAQIGPGLPSDCQTPRRLIA